MNQQEAKETLLLYRPGTADAEDPQVIQAMEVANRNPELARWFEQHRAFQEAMRTKLRRMEAPEHLKIALLAGQKIVRPTIWWQNPVWLAAAAVVVIFIGLSVFWSKPLLPDRFTDYQAMMVSTVLRDYRMDWETTDMQQLRQLISKTGAPGDYHLSQGLERLHLTGGGSLRWRSKPVAMVCFDRGDKKMLFLFVMNRSAVKDPPPEQPKLAMVSTLKTAAWTSGDKAYLLAGPADTDFSNKYP